MVEELAQKFGLHEFAWVTAKDLFVSPAQGDKRVSRATFNRWWKTLRDGSFILELSDGMHKVNPDAYPDSALYTTELPLANAG